MQSGSAVTVLYTAAAWGLIRGFSGWWGDIELWRASGALRWASARQGKK